MEKLSVPLNGSARYNQRDYPQGMPGGSHYRVRIVSSSPFIYSADNGSDIVIYPSLAPENVNGKFTVCPGEIENYKVLKVTGVQHTWTLPTPNSRYRLSPGRTTTCSTSTNSTRTGCRGPGAALSFTARSITTNLGDHALGQLTGWIDLDPAISNEAFGVLGTLTLGGGTITSAVVTSEWALRDGAQLRPLVKRESRVDGPAASLVFPGAGVDAGRTNLAALVETEGMLFQRYLSYARPHAVKPADRPREFMVVNGLIGLSSSIASLNDGLETLAELGHNTVQAWGFSPQIRPRPSTTPPSATGSTASAGPSTIRPPTSTTTPTSSPPRSSTSGRLT